MSSDLRRFVDCSLDDEAYSSQRRAAIIQGPGVMQKSSNTSYGGRSLRKVDRTRTSIVLVNRRGPDPRFRPSSSRPYAVESGS
jgi:hypothetical protein